jgi:hypothetical protein
MSVLIVGLIFFLLFCAMFISALREKNWSASFIWAVPLFVTIICWIVLLFIN